MLVARRIRAVVADHRRRGLMLVDLLLILAIFIHVLVLMFPAGGLVQRRAQPLREHPNYGPVANNAWNHGGTIIILSEDTKTFLCNTWENDEVDLSGLDEIYDRYNDLINANLILQNGVQNCIDIETDPQTDRQLTQLLDSLQKAEAYAQLILDDLDRLRPE